MAVVFLIGILGQSFELFNRAPIPLEEGQKEICLCLYVFVVLWVSTMPLSLLSLLWHSLLLNLSEAIVLTIKPNVSFLLKNWNKHTKKNPNILGEQGKGGTMHLKLLFNTWMHLISSGCESLYLKSQCRTQSGPPFGFHEPDPFPATEEMERERWVSLCGVAISPQSLVWECAGVTRSPAHASINIRQLTRSLLSMSLWLSLTACIEHSERLEIKLDKPQQGSKSYPFLIWIKYIVTQQNAVINSFGDIQWMWLKYYNVLLSEGLFRYDHQVKRDPFDQALSQPFHHLLFSPSNLHILSLSGLIASSLSDLG